MNAIKKILSLVFTLSIICFSCSENYDLINPQFEDGILLSYGTSFGFCKGYCKKVIVVSEKKITFTKSSWDESAYPAKSIEELISADEYSGLLESYNYQTFFGLNEIYGCPDCADGGAEFIQVASKELNKKVTIEFGDSLKPVQNLLAKLRAIHSRFE